MLSWLRLFMGNVKKKLHVRKDMEERMCSESFQNCNPMPMCSLKFQTDNHIVLSNGPRWSEDELQELGKNIPDNAL